MRLILSEFQDFWFCRTVIVYYIYFVQNIFCYSVFIICVIDIFVGLLAKLKIKLATYIRILIIALAII